jgi:ribosomal protein S18 acetylase RimI-like enzyme
MHESVNAGIEIQPALPEQASLLSGIMLMAKAHWGYPEKWMQFWLPQLTISPQYITENETWAAFVDETPVAYYSLKWDGGELWLDNLWVLPEYMGQGIGGRLFDHAMVRARLKKFSILKIEADPNAQGFYERMGAHKTGEHRGDVDGLRRLIPVLEINL